MALTPSRVRSPKTDVSPAKAAEPGRLKPESPKSRERHEQSSDIASKTGDAASETDKDESLDSLLAFLTRQHAEAQQQKMEAEQHRLHVKRRAELASACRFVPGEPWRRPSSYPSPFQKHMGQLPCLDLSVNDAGNAARPEKCYEKLGPDKIPFQQASAISRLFGEPPQLPPAPLARSMASTLTTTPGLSRSPAIRKPPARHPPTLAPATGRKTAKQGPDWRVGNYTPREFARREYLATRLTPRRESA